MKKVVNGIEVDCSPEEIAERAAFDAAWLAGQPERDAVNTRLTLDTQEQVAVKADAQVRQFLNMSPADLDAWVDTNIGGAATLAAVKTAVATALKVLGRIALAAARGRTLR